MRKDEADGFRRGLCWVLAVLALWAAGLRKDVRAEESTAEKTLEFQLIGTPAWDYKKAGFYTEASVYSERLGSFEKQDRCEIVGSQQGFYRVLMNGQIGYIKKDMVVRHAEVRSDDLPEQAQNGFGIADDLPYTWSYYLRLTGTIQSEKPLDALFAYVWNEQQCRLERAYQHNLASPVNTVDANELKTFISLDQMRSGRRILVIEGASGGEMSVLFRGMFYLRGSFQEPPHVTDKCTVSAWELLDGGFYETWTSTEGRPSVTVDIPQDAQAALMVMEWMKPPEGFTVALYGEENRLISETEYATGFYKDSVPLTQEVRRAVITPCTEGASMSTLRIYAEPYDRHSVQQWQPVPDKLDLMVISTHEDDELLFFGGTIPFYAHRGEKMAVVYMANCGRMRYREALNGLWTAGLHTHPIFMEMRDYYANNMEDAEEAWRQNGQDPLMALVRVIRQYRPEVIVTHDFNGEYGHPQHKVTAKLAAEALESAADAAYDPASVEAWGAWQVKKVYIHLYQENQILMDWDAPLEEGSSITPLFLAKEAYDKHRLPQMSYSMEKEGVEYDNRLFGLYYTAVGPDVEKNDFMEHIEKAE